MQDGFHQLIKWQLQQKFAWNSFRNWPNGMAMAGIFREWLLTWDGWSWKDLGDISSLDSLFDETSSSSSCGSQHCYWQSETSLGRGTLHTAHCSCRHVTWLVGEEPNSDGLALLQFKVMSAVSWPSNSEQLYSALTKPLRTVRGLKIIFWI